MYSWHREDLKQTFVPEYTLVFLPIRLKALGGLQVGSRLELCFISLGPSGAKYPYSSEKLVSTGEVALLSVQLTEGKQWEFLANST